MLRITNLIRRPVNLGFLGCLNPGDTKDFKTEYSSDIQHLEKLGMIKVKEVADESVSNFQVVEPEIIESKTCNCQQCQEEKVDIIELIEDADLNESDDSIDESFDYENEEIEEVEELDNNSNQGTNYQLTQNQTKRRKRKSNK